MTFQATVRTQSLCPERTMVEFGIGAIEVVLRGKFGNSFYDGSTKVHVHILDLHIYRSSLSKECTVSDMEQISFGFTSKGL